MSETPQITSQNNYDTHSVVPEHFDTPFNEELALAARQSTETYDPEINHMTHPATPEIPGAPEMFRDLGLRIKQVRLDKIAEQEMPTAA